jgi:hypothetical protein
MIYAGLAFIARIALQNMASPVRSAFAMEILAPSERGTQVGVELAFSAALSGVTSYVGAQLMNAGDFRTPFFLLAGFYLVAAVLFWQFFAGREGSGAVVVMHGAEAAAAGD